MRSLESRHPVSDINVLTYKLSASVTNVLTRSQKYFVFIFNVKNTGSDNLKPTSITIKIHSVSILSATYVSVYSK